jgi:CheY-like chemotaxis protein
MRVRPCALIVEDEPLIALDLEDAMEELGFYVCGVAATEDRARSLAVSDQPDLVLMDVCLEGGREGIETARWLRKVCRTEVVFVTLTPIKIPCEGSMSRCPERRCWRSPCGASFLLKPWRRFSKPLLAKCVRSEGC